MYQKVLLVLLYCNLRKDYNLKWLICLGRIQDLTKEGSDKRLLKALAPGGPGDMLPRKIFNFRASEMRFPAFSGAI